MKTFESRVLEVFRNQLKKKQGLDIKLQSKPDQVHVWVHKTLLMTLMSDIEHRLVICVRTLLRGPTLI